METVPKTITLTEMQIDWIKAQIEAGRYASESECIGDLIHREQERTAQAVSVNAALVAGEASGEPQAFDAAEFKRRMLKAHG